MVDINSSKLRNENSVQYSGHINIEAIPKLKNSHYYIEDVHLDGDAPKQYIRAYIYYKNCPKRKNYKKWHGYYAKFGGKSYPHESIIEYGLNKIGEGLGLNMNETRLVNVGGQIRFLSKDFIARGKKKLIHGVEILHEYFEDRDFVDQINDDRKQRRELLTFEEVESAIRHTHPIQGNQLLVELIKLITYDAIIGNNDRHFYNWGVIGDIEDINNRRVEFAPIYDTARGLFWNFTEDKIISTFEQYQNGSKSQIEAFLDNSKPRFSFLDNTKANHFELIEYLCKRDDSYKNSVSSLVSMDVEKEVLLQLKTSIARYISTERMYLMSEVLRLRFIRLRAIIDD